METRTIPLLGEAAERDVADRLARGELVAVPTETVYGLAADASNGEAVARIFEAKGRPRFNPLIAHVTGRSMAERYAVPDALAHRLMDAFWPGPLTIVLPLRPGAPLHPLVTADLPTVALRSPQGGLSRILAFLGRAVAAPSANRSGRVSPTSAAHVLRTLDGRIEAVADAGTAAHGIESTIVQPRGDHVVLLRPGAVTAAEIEAATGLAVRRHDGHTIVAPGQMRSHYAPHGRVRLDAPEPAPGEHFIAFGPLSEAATARATAVFQLSETGDLREAASRLFDALSTFDAPEIERIAVAPIPREGLGEAINDRLSRAAADR
ncbi:L-threonylcarbamoyladenylate synthase [Aureimonas sp. Leaf324]|uniref:L-threonylcarbamoyladenylate synthase n=1 Tax=Aureimonas sp. Leaf324 TaxID=1736336 RepID=UPI001FCD615A|nr:L-threonylcarbamoyladenylate synthase [Aureimonas sp. Leaf324]